MTSGRYERPSSIFAELTAAAFSVLQSKNSYSSFCALRPNQDKNLKSFAASHTAAISKVPTTTSDSATSSPESSLYTPSDPKSDEEEASNSSGTSSVLLIKHVDEYVPRHYSVIGENTGGCRISFDDIYDLLNHYEPKDKNYQKILGSKVKAAGTAEREINIIEQQKNVEKAIVSSSTCTEAFPKPPTTETPSPPPSSPIPAIITATPADTSIPKLKFKKNIFKATRRNRSKRRKTSSLMNNELVVNPVATSYIPPSGIPFPLNPMHIVSMEPTEEEESPVKAREPKEVKDAEKLEKQAKKSLVGRLTVKFKRFVRMGRKSASSNKTAKTFSSPSKKHSQNRHSTPITQLEIFLPPTNAIITPAAEEKIYAESMFAAITSPILPKKPKIAVDKGEIRNTNSLMILPPSAPKPIASKPKVHLEAREEKCTLTSRSPSPKFEEKYYSPPTTPTVELLETTDSGNVANREIVNIAVQQETTSSSTGNESRKTTFDLLEFLPTFEQKQQQKELQKHRIEEAVDEVDDDEEEKFEEWVKMVSRLSCV